MLSLYISCLWFWIVYIKSISYVLPRKHLTCSALLHTCVSIYLSHNNYNEYAFINSIAYYTNDTMYIVHTNYYNRKEQMFYLFHHIVSIYLISLNMYTEQRELLTIMYKMVELSNIPLYIYYYTTKLTKDKYIIAIMSIVETIWYGYYRLGLSIQYFEHKDTVDKLTYQKWMILGLFLFGVYSLIFLTSNMVFQCNKTIQLHNRKKVTLKK